MDENGGEDSSTLVWPPVGMLQCPKDDCPRLFTSRGSMEAHQVAYEDHAFCKSCNVQFMTHEELFLHQLASKRHHNCPICNRSFNSDAGRDFHIQTDHPEDQGLACPGCQKTFSSNLDYQAHIISNSCNNSKVVALNDHNDRRRMMKKALQDASQLTLNFNLCSDDDNYRHGSNEIEPSRLVQPQTPAKQLPGATSDESPAKSGHKSNHGCKLDSHNLSPAPISPCTRASDGEDSPVSTPPSSNLPTIILNLPISPDDLIGWDDNLDEGVWPPPSTPSLHRGRGLHQNSHPLSLPKPIRDILPNWNSEDHYNSESKRYFCECGFTSPYVKVFEQHAVMEQTGARRKCTHCGKHYASASALFAHVEKEHTKTEPSTPQSSSPEKAIAANDFGERRLNIDGSMDIGELEFQIYDRPPNIAQRNPRYRPKMSFGLRSSKVPHGTYW